MCIIAKRGIAVGIALGEPCLRERACFVVELQAIVAVEHSIVECAQRRRVGDLRLEDRSHGDGAGGVLRGEDEIDVVDEKVRFRCRHQRNNFDPLQVEELHEFDGILSVACIDPFDGDRLIAFAGDREVIDSIHIEGVDDFAGTFGGGDLY